MQIKSTIIIFHFSWNDFQENFNIVFYAIKTHGIQNIMKNEDNKLFMFAIVVNWFKFNWFNWFKRLISLILDVKILFDSLLLWELS